MKRILTAAIVAAGLTAQAQAAQIWVNPAEGHGHVIHIKGEIEKGDANQFANVVGHAGVKPNDATVWLDSPGGLVIEGTPIARAIKKYGWNTYVTKDTACASMCAVIWLAGHTRFVHVNGRVGFHSATNKMRPGKRSELGNAMMFSLYHELGVSDKAARVFLAAEPGDDAIWLTADLADSLGIAAATITPDDETGHVQPKQQDKPSLDKTANDPIGTKLADLSATPQLPAKDAGDAGPPPVKPSDLFAPPAQTEQPPQHEQPQHHAERPQHHRRYAGGYGGRVCGFSIPVPYIGGVTIRGRC